MVPTSMAIETKRWSQALWPTTDHSTPLPTPRRQERTYRSVRPCRHVTSRDEFSLRRSCYGCDLARADRLARGRHVERLACLTRFERERNELDLLVRQVPRGTAKRVVARVMLAQERSDERLTDTLGVVRSGELRCELIRCHVVTPFRFDTHSVSHYDVHMRICTIRPANRNVTFHNWTTGRNVTSRCMFAQHATRMQPRQRVVCSPNMQHVERVVRRGNPPAPLRGDREQRAKRRLDPTKNSPYRDAYVDRRN